MREWCHVTLTLAPYGSADHNLDPLSHASDVSDGEILRAKIRYIPTYISHIGYLLQRPSYLAKADDCLAS